CLSPREIDQPLQGSDSTAHTTDRPREHSRLIQQVNPVVRGWGHHYKRAHVRKLFHRLDGWLVRRIWSHRHRKWRCCGWSTLPRSQLYGEYGLVNLVAMIPSLATRRTASS